MAVSDIAHAPSWYAATSGPIPERAGLTENLSVDVCVIGGGFAGLSAALHLAEAGRSIVLLEAQRVGWGASGRNGGQIHSGFRREPDWFADRFGPDSARDIWQTAEAAKALVRTLIDRHGIDCDDRTGLLHCCHRARDVAGEHAWAERMATRYDYPLVDPLDRAAIQDATGTDVYFGGWRDRGGGHLHPLKFALGLARAAETAGVRLFEGTKAIAVTKTGSRFQVRTSTGDVNADQVIIAGNGYVENLHAELDARVLPISNYIIATEPVGAGMPDGPLAVGDCASDSRFVVYYWRPTPDGRLLFGGGETYTRAISGDIEGLVRRHFLRIYPQFADLGVSHAWGGVLAVTANRLPLVRCLEPGLYAMGGFSGQGVALAPFAGKVIADALLGDARTLTLLENMPCPRFPGGRRMRAPILALGLLWFALRDRL